jgi:hypothetical protein
MAKKFAHRHNKDGSYDSICLYCFLTVATEVQEGQLSEPEQEHSCYEMQEANQQSEAVGRLRRA